MTSLRARLTRLVCIASIPLAAAVGLGLFFFMRSALLSRFDDGLLACARALAGMVKIEDGHLELDFGGELMPQYERAGSGEAFQIWMLDGENPGSVVERSASAAADLPARVPSNETLVWDAQMPGGGAARFAAVRFLPRPDPEGAPESAANPPDPRVGHQLLLVAGQVRAEVDRTLGLLAGAIAGAGVILISGSLVAVRAALARGLRPVAELASAVASIGPADLSRRLPASDSPSELRPIADRTNELLERLSAAFEREKRLAASAAHELRTPIAEVRSVAELALSRERDPAELRRALATIVEVTARMGDSADAILRLARIQAGRERPKISPVNLRGAFAPAWERWTAPLQARGVRAAVDVPDDLTVRADIPMLGVILENVLANAAEHTPGGGSIIARVGLNANATELVISNSTRDGLGAPHVDGALHTGLGLKIAAAMAEACGGRCIAERTGGEFVVRLEFP